jgi:putative membrane protein
MTDLKRERVFEQPELNLNQTLDDRELRTSQPLTTQEFTATAEFTELTPNADELANRIAETIKPNMKYQRTKGFFACTFLALVGWQLGDRIVTSISTQDWLSLGWTGFIAGLSVFGIARIGREILALRKLRYHFSLQQQAEAIIERNSVGQAESFCGGLANKGTATVDREALAAWKNQIHSAHSDAEVFALYDNIVMKKQDKLALDVISNYSSQSAVLVAISPLALADMLLVAWRSLKMVDELSVIYGVELGYWARIRLFKSIVKNMAFAGATELAIESGLDLLSTSVATKLSARAGQGIGVGILSARFGIQALTLLRPLPWYPDQALKLGHVRKQIIEQVKTRLLKTSSN